MLKKLYTELVLIRKELQAIRSSMEFFSKKTLDIEKIENSLRDEVIHRQIRLDQRSLGRLLQPERSEQQSLRKRSR